jgi:hypothetical protein
MPSGGNEPNVDRCQRQRLGKSNKIPDKSGKTTNNFAAIKCTEEWDGDVTGGIKSGVDSQSQILVFVKV